MSFDLAVWHTPTRLTDAQAGDLYAALCEPENDGLPPRPAVEAFYADLTTRYPEVDKVPDELVDDHDYSPWSCALDRSPGHVLMPCVWSQAENVFWFVRGLAARHGLAVYDPQEGRIHYPDG
jgi:hypothetical protein